jgi:ribose 5-phosphate isomerase RpiB
MGAGVIEQVVEVFMTTSFDGDRHQRRVAKIEREDP